MQTKDGHPSSTGRPLRDYLGGRGRLEAPASNEVHLLTEERWRAC